MRDELRRLVAEMVRKGIPLDMAKREFERVYLEEVVAAHKGNQSAAARVLGIHRNTLSKKLETPSLALRRRASLAS
jgi:DNA-binding protein Fis